MRLKNTISLCALMMLGTGTMSAVQEYIPVPIIVHLPGETPIARTPSAIRIKCGLDTDLNVLLISMRGLKGTVAVLVENLTTGEANDFEIEATQPSVLPISGTSGLWTVTFTLESGVTYYGEFEL